MLFSKLTYLYITVRVSNGGTMIDHTEVWQLKVKISNRIADGSMTVEQLRAFVGSTKEELEKHYPSTPKTPPWGLREDL